MRRLYAIATIGCLAFAGCNGATAVETAVPSTGNLVDDALMAIGQSSDDASAGQQIAVAIEQATKPQWKVSPSTCKLVDGLGARAAEFHEGTARLFVRLLGALPCNESFTLLVRCVKGQWRANTGITRAGAFALLIPMGASQNRTSEVVAVVADTVGDQDDFVRATAYRYALHHATTNAEQASLLEAIGNDPSPYVTEIAQATVTGGAP